MRWQGSSLHRPHCFGDPLRLSSRLTGGRPMGTEVLVMLFAPARGLIHPVRWLSSCPLLGGSITRWRPMAANIVYASALSLVTLSGCVTTITPFVRDVRVDANNVLVVERCELIENQSRSPRL